MIFRGVLMDVAQEWIRNIANLNEPAKSRQLYTIVVFGSVS